MLLKNTKHWPQWAFGRDELRKSFASNYWDWDFIHELTEEVLYDQLLKKEQLRVFILPTVEDIENKPSTATKSSKMSENSLSNSLQATRMARCMSGLAVPS